MNHLLGNISLRLFAEEGGEVAASEANANAVSTVEIADDDGRLGRLRALGVPESKLKKQADFRKNTQNTLQRASAQRRVQDASVGMRSVEDASAALQSASATVQGAEPKQQVAAATANAEEKTPGRMSWEDIMADPVYNRQMQQTMQSRLRSAKAAEQTLQQLAPAISLLAQKYGLRDNNAEALVNAIRAESRGNMAKNGSGSVGGSVGVNGNAGLNGSAISVGSAGFSGNGAVNATNGRAVLNGKAVGNAGNGNMAKNGSGSMGGRVNTAVNPNAIVNPNTITNPATQAATAANSVAVQQDSREDAIKQQPLGMSEGTLQQPLGMSEGTLQQPLGLSEGTSQPNTGEETIRRHLQGLTEQGERLKMSFPAFDLRAELKNPAFVRMTSPAVGLSVEDAYFACHRHELQAAAMQAAAERTAQQLAASIRAGQTRPQENGGQAPSVTHFNYASASREQREALKKSIRMAAARGERLYPGS